MAAKLARLQENAAGALRRAARSTWFFRWAWTALAQGDAAGWRRYHLRAPEMVLHFHFKAPPLPPRPPAPPAPHRLPRARTRRGASPLPFAQKWLQAPPASRSAVRRRRAARRRGSGSTRGRCGGATRSSGCCSCRHAPPRLPSVPLPWTFDAPFDAPRRRVTLRSRTVETLPRPPPPRRGLTPRAAARAGAAPPLARLVRLALRLLRPVPQRRSARPRAPLPNPRTKSV